MPIKPKARAGRQPCPSTTAGATAVSDPDEPITTTARRHAKAALAALVDVMGNPEASPAARISAAGVVLTWAFGRKSLDEPETERPTKLVVRWLKPGEKKEEAERSGA